MPLFEKIKRNRYWKISTAGVPFFLYALAVFNTDETWNLVKNSKKSSDRFRNLFIILVVLCYTFIHSASWEISIADYIAGKSCRERFNQPPVPSPWSRSGNIRFKHRTEATEPKRKWSDRACKLVWGRKWSMRLRS